MAGPASRVSQKRDITESHRADSMMSTLTRQQPKDFCDMAHSDWVFEHSVEHSLPVDSHIDPHSDISTPPEHSAQIDSVTSVLKTLWHQHDAMTGSSTSAAASSSAAVGGQSAGASKSVAPTLTVGSNALTVDAGGSVALPITVSPAWPATRR
jgi:hypothetical protein